MRTFKLIGLSLATLATVTAAMPAMARPHHRQRVCHMERHHGHPMRVCHWAR